jgi:hypothetical protein
MSSDWAPLPPPPDAPPIRPQSNGLAIAALVCGIVGFFLLGIVLGPLGIIFGGLGLRRANAGARGRGMALAGLIVGIIDTVLYIVVILAFHKVVA